MKPVSTLGYLLISGAVPHLFSPPGPALSFLFGTQLFSDHGVAFHLFFHFVAPLDVSLILLMLWSHDKEGASLIYLGLISILGMFLILFHFFLSPFLQLLNHSASGLHILCLCGSVPSSSFDFGAVSHLFSYVGVLWRSSFYIGSWSHPNSALKEDHLTKNNKTESYGKFLFCLSKCFNNVIF